MGTFGVNIAGGLCNMMFQVAFGEWMANQSGNEVVYSNVNEHFKFLVNYGKWVAHAMEYMTAFENVDWLKHQKEVAPKWDKVLQAPFHYEPVEIENNAVYHGYFQSEKYFGASHVFIRKLFQPSVRVRARLLEYANILSDKTCSIHVRRGNYLDYPEVHPVLGMGYYHKAIEMQRANGVVKFLVFSNDIPWCTTQFKGDEFVFIQDTDYVEMFLMAACKNNIIANSSFSWWGAYLGLPFNRLVIAPERWFGERGPNGKDIVPDKWTKI